MASAPILHLGTWDGYTPVMLPYGAKTMDGIVAASNGVMVPFIIFVLFMFRFFYHNQWLQEYNRLAASSGQLHADTCCSAPRATMGDIPAHRSAIPCSRCRSPARRLVVFQTWQEWS